MVRLLATGVRVVLLRELGKVCASDPKYIEELKASFNDQQFVLNVYATIYARSGPHVTDHCLDFNCLYKAILEVM